MTWLLLSICVGTLAGGERPGNTKQDSPEERASRPPWLIRVANMNALGIAYNPVEFLQSSPEFLQEYTTLVDAFGSVETRDVLKEAQRIADSSKFILKEQEGVHWLTTKFNGTNKFQEYVQAENTGEQFLNKDNKFAYEFRTNLVCGALVPNLNLASWRERIQGQASVYSAASELLLWDIACNLAAEKAGKVYEDIVRKSYLNAAKSEQYMRIVIQALMDGVYEQLHVTWETRDPQLSDKERLFNLWDAMLRRQEFHSPQAQRPQGTPDAIVVMGVEEFPESGPRRDALESVLTQTGMKFIPPTPEKDRSSGLVYSGNLPSPPEEDIVTSPLGHTSDEILQTMTEAGSGFSKDAILQRLKQWTDACKAGEDVTSKKEKQCESDGSWEKFDDSLATTARKTLVVDFKHVLRVIVIHAKEFKSSFGYEFLAQYVRVLAKRDSFAGTTVMVSDANTASDEASKTFIAALKAQSFQVLPEGQFTTQKKRSILHGQIYDKKKCLHTIAAQKDYIAVHQPSPIYEVHVPMDGVAAPDLMTSAEMLLPNNEWPSDHSMVRADLLLRSELTVGEKSKIPSNVQPRTVREHSVSARGTAISTNMSIAGGSRERWQRLGWQWRGIADQIRSITAKCAKLSTAKMSDSSMATLHDDLTCCFKSCTTSDTIKHLQSRMVGANCMKDCMVGLAGSSLPFQWG